MSSCRALVTACLITGTALPALCSAGDQEHRHVMNAAAVMSAATDVVIPYPFFSTFEGAREEGIFRDSAGMLVYSAPPSARSAYDSTISHDLRDFYRASNLRSRMVLNMADPYTKVYFSVGVDTGSNAPKFAVSKSYFVGMTRGFKFHASHYVIASAGKWFGMRVSERPCLDSYNREYWCPALVAWADRPEVRQPKSEGYLDLKYSFLF